MVLVHIPKWFSAPKSHGNQIKLNQSKWKFRSQAYWHDCSKNCFICIRVSLSNQQMNGFLLLGFALAAEWKTEWKSKVQMKWLKEEVSGVRSGKPFYCGVETTLMMTTATVAVTRRQLNIVHIHSAIWPPSWLNECAHLLYGKSTFCSVFFISRLFLIVAVLFIHFFSAAAAIAVAVTAAVQTMLLRIWCACVGVDLRMLCHLLC